jgi:hypothetical protein
VKLEIFQLFLDTPDKGFFNVIHEYAYNSKAPNSRCIALRGRGFLLPIFGKSNANIKPPHSSNE